MNRPRFLTLAFVIGALAGGSLKAAPTLTPEEIRDRMEQSLQRQQRTVDNMAESLSHQRQRRSVESMADSLANQQRSLTKQRGASLAADFFRPAPWLTEQPVASPSGCASLPSQIIESLNASATET